MFSKLPQSLGAPFGLLGDEAKLGFRSQPNGIAKLSSTRNISERDSYWDQFFVLFDSPSDVYSLVTPNDIRRSLYQAPENVATLVRVVTARLFTLISDHTFPSASPNSMTSMASSFVKSRMNMSERSTTKEVLNCVRLLQRILPVIFEIDSETNVFEAEVLWKREEVPDSSLTNDSVPQFVIDDEEDNEEDGGSADPASSSTQSKPKQELPSLAERLFSALVDLLFCCGFTLPTKIQVDHHKINYVIWEKGVGSTTDPGPNSAYDSNKIEVLRLLLVLLSRQIYVPSGALLTNPSKYTIHFVQQTQRRHVLTVLCSLLNTAMNGNTATLYTIEGLAGKLPYNHLVIKGEDTRTTLVSLCLQVLDVVLDFQSGGARDNQTGSGDNVSSMPSMKTNAFRYYIAKLHRAQDLTFILDGVLNVMQSHAAGMTNVLPGATKPIPFISEQIFFLWKMVELNKKFRTSVFESDKGMDLVAYLLLYMLDIKDKPQQHGICRALSYVLQMISSEPTFGAKLSSPLRVNLPAKWQSPGTSGDFLINAIYSIITTTSGTLSSLYPALIISLANAAPYFKGLTVTAAARLIQLLSSFSNPLFLLSDEGNPRLLFFMLEVFNYIILHRLSDNPNVTYAILTSHKTFEDLGTFNLARGLRDVKRAQQAKEEQRRRQEARAANPTSDPLDSAERGTLEKQSQSPGHSQRGSRDDVTLQMPTSPTTENMPTISDKAKGKRKAQSPPTSIDLNAEAIALGIGKNGFVPTHEWVTSWQQGLPLDIILILIAELLPKVQEIQASRAKANSPDGIRDFLAAMRLDHVLPPVPPVSPRRFTWTDSSIVWLTSLIWGEVYVRHMTPLGIWNSTNVRLFYVKHTQSQQRLSETVSSVMGGFLGRSNSEQSLTTRRS